MKLQYGRVLYTESWEKLIGFLAREEVIEETRGSDLDHVEEDSFRSGFSRYYSCDNLYEPRRWQKRLKSGSIIFESGMQEKYTLKTVWN